MFARVLLRKLKRALDEIEPEHSERPEKPVGRLAVSTDKAYEIEINIARSEISKIQEARARLQALQVQC